MRDVIQKMLEAETEANRIAQSADAEAERLVAEARAETQAAAQRAREAAKAEAERIVAAAVEEAEREKTERLATATAEIEVSVRLDDAVLGGAVEAVVRAVAGVH
jgi:vacuolar-type H+-ATPase subunit H